MPSINTNVSSIQSTNSPSEQVSPMSKMAAHWHNTASPMSPDFGKFFNMSPTSTQPSAPFDFSLDHTRCSMSEFAALPSIDAALDLEQQPDNAAQFGSAQSDELLTCNVEDFIYENGLAAQPQTDNSFMQNLSEPVFNNVDPFAAPPTQFSNSQFDFEIAPDQSYAADAVDYSQAGIHAPLGHDSSYGYQDLANGNGMMLPYLPVQQQPFAMYGYPMQTMPIQQQYTMNAPNYEYAPTALMYDPYSVAPMMPMLQSSFTPASDRIVESIETDDVVEPAERTAKPKLPRLKTKFPTSKTRRASTEASEVQRRNSSISTTSPLTPPEKTPDRDTPVRTRHNRRRVFRAERPVKDEAHDWIRINHHTRGKSTRTGKINRWDPQRDGKYIDVEHPFGPWTTSDGFKFEYDKWDELAQPATTSARAKTPYTADQLEKFIYEHPTDPETRARLVLWIQRVPADSAKRYPTESGDRCRFHDCPGSKYKRNIGVGLYRVAFDEKWSVAGDQQDPFIVAGYAHLYCLERFLDFAEICAKFDVRADDREMMTEPRGRFAPSLGFESDEWDVADRFIRAAKKGKLAKAFPGYPKHPAHPKGAPKDHKKTLTYALTEAKNANQSISKLRMYEERGIKPSNILMHMGDLQMQIDAKAENFAKNKPKKSKKRRVVESDEESEAKSSDDEVVEVEQPPKRTRHVRQASSKSSSTVGRKRKGRSSDDDDDDNDSDDEYKPSSPCEARAAKRSRRNK